MFSVLILLMAFVCNLCFVLVSSAELDLFDEGSTLYAARQISRGDVLYKDHLYYKMPLPYYFLGLIFYAFDCSIMVSRITIAIVGAGILWLFYLLARRILPFKYAFFITIAYYPWAIPMINNYYVGWIAQLMMLFFLHAAIHFNHRLSFFSSYLTGIFLGLTILAKQTYGSMMVAGFFCWLPFLLWQRIPKGKRFSRLICFGSGASLGILVVLGLTSLYFALNRGFYDFIYYTMGYPLIGEGFAEGIALPFPFYQDWSELSMFVGLPLAYVITLCVALFWRTGISQRLRLDMLLLAITGSLSYVTLYPRSDFKHLVCSLFFGFLCYGLILHWIQKLLSSAMTSSSLRAYRLMLPYVVIFLVSTSIGGIVVKITGMYKIPVRPLQLDHQLGVLVSYTDAEIIESVLKTIDELSKPSDPVYVGPWAPLLYILSGRQNPTRFRMFSSGHFSQDKYLQEIVKNLEIHKTPLIVWALHSRVQSVWGRDPQHFGMIVQTYISRCYRKVRQVGQFTFYARICDNPD